MLSVLMYLNNYYVISLMYLNNYYVISVNVMYLNNYYVISVNVSKRLLCYQCYNNNNNIQYLYSSL